MVVLLLLCKKKSFSNNAINSDSKYPWGSFRVGGLLGSGVFRVASCIATLSLNQVYRLTFNASRYTLLA